MRSGREFLRATAVGVVVAAAGPSTAQEGRCHTVETTDQLVFDPDSLTISPGDTVVRENVGAIGHSVTAHEEDIPAEYGGAYGEDG